jgi:hypothetical protein
MMIWTKNLKDPEVKKRFESTLWGSKPVLDRLSQLLSEEEAELDRTEISAEAYDNPNWSYKQAHKNGQRAMLRKIQNLINLDQQNVNRIHEQKE